MGNSIWGPYWSYMDVPRWVPDESLLQNQHRSHMGCPYRTHIITHLGPIWVLYSLLAGGQYEVDEIEKNQNEAVCILTGATRLVSINLLHCETGWESLATRRNKHKISMFHKMYTGLSLAYLSALLPATIGANVSYNLRNPNNLQTVQCRSQLYYKSFLPSAIQTFNCLPEDSRNVNNTASLKNKLNRDLNRPPKYNNEGNRLTQIFHSRLRTEQPTKCLYHISYGG